MIVGGFIWVVLTIVVAVFVEDVFMGFTMTYFLFDVNCCIVEGIVGKFKLTDEWSFVNSIPNLGLLDS